jgi:hypothetical protein
VNKYWKNADIIKLGLKMTNANNWVNTFSIVLLACGINRKNKLGTEHASATLRPRDITTNAMLVVQFFL